MRVGECPTPIEIQRLVVQDISNLLLLEAQTEVSSWDEQQFQKEFENPASIIYGAKYSSQLLGYLIVRNILDELHVVNIVVVKDSQGQGIATRLLKHALEQAQQAGQKRALLEVRAGNLPALAVYKKLGFIRTGVRAGYYAVNAEDGLLFELDL